LLFSLWIFWVLIKDLIVYYLQNTHWWLFVCFYLLSFSLMLYFVINWFWIILLFLMLKLGFKKGYGFLILLSGGKLFILETQIVFSQNCRYDFLNLFSMFSFCI
jgi:hypothetical protein